MEYNRGGDIMTTEEKLKDLILSRYLSIRDFTNTIGLPYTTLDSMFRRGIGNSSVTNVIKVCKELGISVDALADGEIAPIRKPVSKKINDWIEVKEIIDDTKDTLKHRGFITLEGKPIGVTQLDSIIDAMDVGVELAKKKN